MEFLKQIPLRARKYVESWIKNDYNTAITAKEFNIAVNTCRCHLYAAFTHTDYYCLSIKEIKASLQGK